MRIITVTLLCAIGLSPTMSSAQQKSAADTLFRPFILFQGDTRSRVNAIRGIVVEQAEFQRVWGEAHAAIVPPRPMPPVVDFTKEMVVVAGLGFQGGLTGSISIIDIRDNDNILRIRFRVGLLGPNCESYAAVTYPTVIVKIPRTRSTPVFSDSLTVQRC
jgi:hypothetical protein